VTGEAKDQQMTTHRQSSGLPRVTGWFLFALAVVLVTYSSMVHLIPGFNALYVPVNLAAAGVLAVVAVRVGLEPADFGLERSTMRSGFTWGAAVAGVAAVVLAIGVAVPALRPLFDDARVADIGPGLLAYRALIRIPLGTALFEEFAFRGVLFGAWMRLTSPLRAAVGSSLVFGLWHIRPTIEVLNANDLAMSSVARLSAVAAAVVLTAVAGYVFCLLRLRSRSLLAPIIAHAAINSFAIVAAWIVVG
jgi:membrane protease YdiL (CAAX protease family)